MRSSDDSADVCSSDLLSGEFDLPRRLAFRRQCARRSRAAAADGARGLWRGDLDGRAGDRLALARAILCTPRWAGNGAADEGDGGAPCRPRSRCGRRARARSEEHTSELQSLMRISYAVFCLKKKKKNTDDKPARYILLVTAHTIQTQAPYSVSKS